MIYLKAQQQNINIMWTCVL